MRLRVDHVTRYTYDQPVRAVVQSHRLTPTRFDGQTTLDWQVTVSDGLKGGGFRDGSGDWVQSWSILGPVSQIEVAVRGIVETTDLTGVLRGNRESIPPVAWLAPTPPTEPDVALSELAAGVSGGDDLALAHALAAAVADAIAYRPGATDARTTAAEALVLGEGVCQDHAHIFIAAARSAGVPARYVSGYLRLDETDDQEAGHAWAEAWLPDLGWVGFDISNVQCPDDRYVRLASGLDYREAAPLTGLRRGFGNESMIVTLQVQQ